MEERPYQGFIYRRNGPGEPWQRVGPIPDAQPIADVGGGIRIGTPREQPVPSGYQRNPDGSVTYIPGGPADPAVIAAEAAARRAPDTPQMPNPGAGYRMRPDGTAEAIPGGPADTAANANPDMAANVRTDALDKIALARRLIARSRGEWFGTGFLAPTMANMAGTSAADIAADVDTLRSAGALNQVMTLAQQNGGKNPLTPLSNADMTLLANSLSNLDIGQSDAQFQRNVQSIINLYERAYMAAGGTPQTYSQELAGRLTPEEKQDQLNALIRRNASPEEMRSAASAFFGADNPEMQQWLARYERGNRDPLTVAPGPNGAPPPSGPTPPQGPDGGQGALQTFIRGGANMATGGFGNKIVAGLNSVLPLDRLGGRPVQSVWDGSSLSDAFNHNLGLETRTDANNARNHPIASLAGDVTGGAMAAGLAARAFPGVLAGGAIAPRALAMDAAYGASVGGNQAYDRGQDVATGTILGAGAGLGGGVIGRGVIAPAVGAALATRPGQAVANAAMTVANAPANAVRGMFGRAPVAAPRMAPPPTVSPSQALLARNVTDPQQAITGLQQAESLGLPMAIADTSPAMRRLTGAAYRRSGDEVRNAAEATVRSRSLGQADRALGQIEQTFGPISNPNRVSEELMASARTASRPLYDAAFEQPAPIGDQALQELLGTPAGRSALANARTIAANEGVNPDHIGLVTDELGNVSFSRTPTFRTLDYVKKGFDAQLEPLRNPVTGALPTTDPSVNALQGLRGRFRSRLDELNPDYAAARAAFAGPASSAEALAMGRGANRMQPRDIQDQLARYTPEQADQFRLGARVAMGDTVSNAADTRNPFTSVFGSPTARQRLGAMYDPAQVERFGQVYNIEDQMGRTAQEVLGGSPTAARVGADQEFASTALDHLGTGIVDTITAGGPWRAALNVGRNMLGDRMQLGLGQAAQKKADALLPDLLNTNPAEGRAVLEEALANSGLRLGYNRRMRRIGGMFGYGGAGAAMPLLSQ